MYKRQIFKGKLIGYTENNTLGSYPIKGTLSFHGVTKNIQNVIVQIINLENKLTFKGAFELNPKEFDVEIPKIVSSKIADSVTVVFEFNMTKK